MAHIESAIVTGAAGGIGEAVVRSLVRSGRRVVGVDRDEPALNALRASLPHDAFAPLVGDVADPTTWERAADRSEADGRTTVLVNNAGISPKRNGLRVPGVETDLEQWHLVINVNLTSAFIGTKTVAPLMKQHGKGRIINVSSMAGRTAAAIAGVPYSASKAGLLGLTRSFAGEIGPWGITVNAIAPGRIDTPMMAAGASSANSDAVTKIPVRRFGLPQDIADLVRFLASDEAGFITGVCIDSNGGQFMA